MASFEAPLQHFQTQDAIWEEEDENQPSPEAANRRMRKPIRRPVSAIDRRPGRSALSRKNSQASELEAPNLRTGRAAGPRSSVGHSRLRSQYDELNVLERVFEDIMLHGEDEQEEQGYYYSKINDELMTETEFLEFVEAHPDQLDQCCDVDVAIEELRERWQAVSEQLDQQHWRLSSSMIKTAAADQNAEQQIGEAQEVVRQCFRELRQEIDQREEMVMAEVEAAYTQQLQQQGRSSQGGEEHLERVDRCRELGNRLCNNMKPMLLPFCNKLLFSKAQRLLEKPVMPASEARGFRILPDSQNEHQQLLEKLSNAYKVQVLHEP